MRNVNNKYLIEYEMTVEENFSNYVVKDSEKENKYVLCILKNDFTYEKTREYLLSKFKTIKNLNFDSVTNIIKIEIINIINGIKLDKPQYGYLMEHIESKIDTKKYLEQCNPYKKLDIFMELCAAINTLNMQGYIFDDISIKDIRLVPISKNDVKIKIKNLLQNELGKFNLLNSTMNSLPYQYNIESRDEGSVKKDNIEKVVKLFNQIFTDEDLEHELRELNYIKKLYNQAKSINNSFRLQAFIKDINEKMHKNYKYFTVDALNKLQTDLDIIGMKEEIKIVEKNFQRIIENKETYKIIGFNGEDGSGKTRLIEELRYRIENKYFKDILYVSDFIDKNISGEDRYNKLINFIFERIDKNLKEKYEIYIKKFISILVKENPSKSDNKQKLQLMNRMGKFINEFTMSKTFVLLIDDLDLRNEIFKLFVKYIAFLGNNLENVMIIFSMNEEKCSKDFLEFIKELKELEQYEEYKLNYFNQYNTTQMIKSMLNTNEEMSKLSLRIYSETLGNPQYISGVIKELYENKTLYFNKEEGLWESDIYGKNILIPKVLEKRLELNIASLNEEEITILKKLSIFETPLSETIILKYIITELEERKIYIELKSKGFLEDKISDQGILVGFTNNLLRNILYLKLNDKSKIEMHFTASVFLEEILHETDYYMEEFLIHLEKGESYQKAYFYTNKYAKVQDIMGNSSKAIEYYKKALNYPDAPNKSEVAINIAKLYEKKSKHEKSFEFYDIANQLAIQNDQLEIEIYTLLEMIIIKLNDITDITTGIDYSLNCVRRLLDRISYPKGEIYYYYAISLKYRIEYNNKLALINAEKALNICYENKIKEDVYGWINIILVKIYIKKGNYREAKKLCSNAQEVFVNNNNINGELFSKLYFATISKEEGKSNETILEQYFEVVKLSNKTKVYKREILSLIYISKIYMEEKKYKEAEEFLLRALEREREEGIDVYSFSICNQLCLIYIKLGKINLAIKYYYLTRQMEKGIKLLEEGVVDSNYTYALYNLLICNYNMAYNYLKKIYTLAFNTKSSFHKIIICNYYELMLYKCKSEADIRKVCEKLKGKIEGIENQEIVLEIKINAIRRILSLGYIEIARELFLKIKGYPKDYNLEAMYLYLEFNFRNKNHYNFLINKTLRICEYITNQELKADIYHMIGEKYNELNCNVLAMNYYYESIALHMDITNSLPRSDRLIYINNSRFLLTRDKFIECLNVHLGIDMDFKKIKTLKMNNEVEELLVELSLNKILGNQSVLSLMQNLYENCYYNDFGDIYTVFDRFSSDTISNLENVMKYMARLTLSDKAMIVMENNEGENEVICTYRISDKNEINRYFSLKVDSGEDIFVISNSDDKFNQLDDKVLKDGIKACMYMRIINREKQIGSSIAINARLILITNSALNYINYESKKIIEKFKPFLIFLLEKYNLTISSTLDKLTGVYNRKHFEEALLFLLDSAKLDKTEFAVIMFDIDDFKGVNDKYGHQTGDEVLVKLTTEVNKCITKSDIVGRYGGEEFILLLPNSSKEKAISMAEKIRSNVEAAKILGDKRKVTISIGIAMSSNEALNSQEIIERADQALYKAKNEGKNRFVLWKKDYGISTSTNNELTGVLSGNATRDYNLAVILKEVANIVKYKGEKEDKIYQLILKIMQVIEAETATAFIVKENKIVNMFSKSRAKDGWYVVEKFNFKLIYETIEEEKGRYLIDWESMDNYNHYGIPDWKSVCITPVICNGEILAVIYLSVSVNKREFTLNDYNLLNCFTEIGVSIFERL